MNTYNIAITGANGYIGSSLSTYLKDRGHCVYQMARKPTKNEMKDFIYFELGTKNSYHHLNDMDVLIHCAFDFSLTNFTQSKKINVDGSIDLFKAAKMHGVKKIIYISSISSFPQAQSNYGRIKYAIEVEAKKFNATIIRPGLVFNKFPHGVIASLTKLINKSKIVPFVNLKEKIFYPCHMDDLLELIYSSLQNDFNETMPISAASEENMTFKDLIATLANYQNKKIILCPMPYSILLKGLQFAELTKLNLGLRSDSLKYMKYYNKQVDFNITRQLGIQFRPMNIHTLCM